MKTFIVRFGVTLVVIAILAGKVGAEPAIPRDKQMEVQVNPVGYTPASGKICTVPEDVSVDQFQVRNVQREVVYEGTFQTRNGDFGTGRTGDFSPVTDPGTYYITAGRHRSYPFRIDPNVYHEPLRMTLSYLAAQRCGPSETGYLTPCHLDDGVRKDNGKHRDVTGGWHDASDLRKWVGATIFGMIGLLNVADHVGNSWGDRLAEDLRWGNRYFLSMQTEEGYVMNHVGGRIKEHSDSNRWTDNQIASEHGDLRTVEIKEGRSRAPVTVMGDSDDRVINTDPIHSVGQFLFVYTEAKTARFFQNRDESYAKRCLAAAEKTFDWANENRPAGTAVAKGALLQAASELYKMTQKERYRRVAAEQAQDLINLQITSGDAVHGFFWYTGSKSKPFRKPSISKGVLPLLGLCSMAETFPEHQQVQDWKQAIRRHLDGYVMPLSDRNRFGIVPFGLYTRENPGGDRKIGSYWYRYFMQPDRGWWVGVNTNLASTGVGLFRASRLLDDASYADRAQRQLDWIFGVNPLGSSTMVGVGKNHPDRFVNGNEFHPPTPRLQGAVMNGLGGTKEDEPDRYDASYHTAEYWTPMLGYTMWLMAELMKEK